MLDLRSIILKYIDADVKEREDLFLQYQEQLLSKDAEETFTELIVEYEKDEVRHVALQSFRQSFWMARVLTPLSTDEQEALRNIINNWIWDAENWQESKSFIQSHSQELLSEEADALLQSMYMSVSMNSEFEYSPNSLTIIYLEYLNLLKRCRKNGVDDVYKDFDYSKNYPNEELLPQLIRLNVLDKKSNEDSSREVSGLLKDWIWLPNWKDSYDFLKKNSEKLLSDYCEGLLLAWAMQGVVFNNDDLFIKMFLCHLDIFRRSRSAGLEDAYNNLLISADYEKQKLFGMILLVPLMEYKETNAIFETLEQWILWTEDWEESFQYTQNHSEQLLSDKAEALLMILTGLNPSEFPSNITFLYLKAPYFWNLRENTVSLFDYHLKILQKCRSDGISNVFKKLISSDEPKETFVWFNLSMDLHIADPKDQTSESKKGKLPPITQKILQYFSTATDDDARKMLLDNSDLMFSGDVRKMFDMVKPIGKIANRMFEERKKLWEKEREKLLSPKFSADAQLNNNVINQNLYISNPLARYQSSQYLSINPSNCAIGDNAITINNIGRIPLEWKRPTEFRRDLTENAIGRKRELTKLRSQLSKHSKTIVSGRGSSESIQGLPGIGKSTLAALYCENYAEDYPGGIVWLQLGPSCQTVEIVGLHLNRLAAYAYSGDLQTYSMLAIDELPKTKDEIYRQLRASQFAPEILKTLLSEHGKILFIADDVWKPDLLEPILKSMPLDADLIVTTRNLRVANSVAKKFEVDILSEEDAFRVIRRTIPLMPNDIMKSLSSAVGFHPLALTIAIGDLALREKEQWLDAVKSISNMVDVGKGFGELPLMDEADRENKVEIILAYSYTMMSNQKNGDLLQKRFRALGAFAREDNFSAHAVAAVWQAELDETREFISVLASRGLIKKIKNDRWQQHSILRSYALGLQFAEERNLFSDLHAKYYLNEMRDADDKKEFLNMSSDLANLRHAFSWAVKQDVSLAIDLFFNCRNLLISQNLYDELLNWANDIDSQANSIGINPALGLSLLCKADALLAKAEHSHGVNKKEYLLLSIENLEKALEQKNSMNLMFEYPYFQQEIYKHFSEAYSDLAMLSSSADYERCLEEALKHSSSVMNLTDKVKEKDFFEYLIHKRLMILQNLSLVKHDRLPIYHEALDLLNQGLDFSKDDSSKHASFLIQKATLLLEFAHLQDNPETVLKDTLDAINNALNLASPTSSDFDMALRYKASILRKIAILQSRDERHESLVGALSIYDSLLKGESEDRVNRAIIVINRSNIFLDLYLSNHSLGDWESELDALTNVLPDLESLPMIYSTALRNIGIIKQLTSSPKNIQELVDILEIFNKAAELKKPFPQDYAVTQLNRVQVLVDLAKKDPVSTALYTRDAQQTANEVFEILREDRIYGIQGIKVKVLVATELYDYLDNQDAYIAEVLKELNSLSKNSVHFGSDTKEHLAKIIVRLGFEKFSSLWNDIYPNVPLPVFSSEEGAALLMEFARMENLLDNNTPIDQSVKAILDKINNEPALMRKYLPLTRLIPDDVVDYNIREISRIRYEWIKIKDLDESEKYLTLFRDFLLTDGTEEEIKSQIEMYPEYSEYYGIRLERIRRSREVGINSAYANFRFFQPATSQQAALHQLVFEWLKKAGESIDWSATESFLEVNYKELVNTTCLQALSCLADCIDATELINNYIQIIKYALRNNVKEAFALLNWREENRELITSVEQKILQWASISKIAESQGHLKAQSNELLSELGEKAAISMTFASGGQKTIENYLTLIKSCKDIGIENAYNQLRPIDFVFDNLVINFGIIDFGNYEQLKSVTSNMPDLIEHEVLLDLVNRVEGEVINSYYNKYSAILISILVSLISLRLQRYEEEMNLEELLKIEHTSGMVHKIVTNNKLNLIQPSVLSLLSQVQNAIGSVYDSRSDFENAITNFSLAITTHPLIALNYRNRASAYIRSGNLEDAFHDLEEAEFLEPENGMVFVRWCEYYLKLGGYKDALNSARKCQEAIPSSYLGYLLEGVTQSLLKQQDLAVIAVKKAREQVKKEKDVLDALKSMEEYKEILNPPDYQIFTSLLKAGTNA